MKIAMLGLALSKKTLDKQHTLALLDNIENAIATIRKELDV